MADYTYHKVRQSTIDKLNARYPDAKPGIYSSKLGEFDFENGIWRRMRIVNNDPEFMYVLVYGEFDNPAGVGAVLKLPYRNNWHKRILPAVRRLVKRLGHKKHKLLHNYYLDGTEQAIYDNKNYPTYSFDGKDFV